MIVRQVGTEEWQVVRAARLGALAGSAPGTFATSYDEAAQWDERRWRMWAGGRTLFVAEAESEVLGCAGGLLEDDLAVLVSMFVAAAARGTGTSDRLIETVADWARDGGHADLRLWVLDGNTPAEKLYRRRGFVATGQRRPNAPGDPRIEYEMARAL
ncbi:GNAT family N-acetyltransferase [Nocardia mexicana]|uniref:Acetyltransferase (GNAT) family protein n=1 Tax=Nocardia mexicana TaxID=279262 RepID=A0A370H4C1_9NOCA|nr:GNAT family N-acetyltransferase [Nocardia mexicana]RDI50082.1 acetyltransferase (GNAT) family protein [Nocardia mexicana]